MDLSKISTEDLKAIRSGNWSDVSTPGLQQYQQQRGHQQQAEQQAQNPQAQTIPDSADKAAHPLSQYLNPQVSSADNAIKMAKMNPDGAMAKVMKMTSDQVETPKGVNQLGTTLIPGAQAAASQGMGILGKAGMSALAGGTTAEASGDPENSPIDKLSNFLKGGMVGGLLQGAGSALGKMGDFTMQKSVGMRKYTPGVGTSLADQGVIGTKGMMANQVESKLSEQESKLQDIVQSLKGTVNSKEIADAVSQKAQRFTLPSTGQASPFSQNELQKVRDMSGKISEMGDLSGSDLLALKRQGDYQGYTNSGTPATSTEAELGRTGADAARTALKKMSPDVADTLFKEQSLVKANSALSKPESIHQGNGAAAFFGKLPGQSAAESLVGQAGVKGGRVVSDPRIQRAIEQGLFSQ